MTSPDPSQAARRHGPARWIALAAVVLALVGAVLIVVAVRTSRSGPPQPTAAAAGSIDPYPSTSVTSPAPTAAAQPASSAPSVSTATSPAPTSSPSGSSAAPKSSAATKASVAPTTAHPTTVTHPAPKPKGLILPGAVPVTLSIPSLGVTSSLVQLGLNPDGSVAVPDLNDPDSKAGWYKYSPTPGSLGPSIILGHIDSKKYGPGVFYHLGDLKPGDVVNITRGDGTVAVFRIDGVRSYPKNDFPTPTVYGNLDYAGLRLITCGGVFDPDAGSYESNIVAFGSLVSSHHA